MSQNGENQRFPLFLFFVYLISVMAGSILVVHHATNTPTYTIDAYFYLSKAKQLAAGNGLTTTWNDGIDAKYFPGYSILLAAPMLFEITFVPVQLVAYWWCVCLVVVVSRYLRLDRATQFLVATAFAVNPIVLKWLAHPMAEGVALMLALASVLLFLISIEAKRPSLLLAACMVGGVAVITRIESLFLLAVFGIIAVSERRSVSWRSLVAGAILFVLPLAGYWFRMRAMAGYGPAYIGELRDTFLRFDVFKNAAYNLLVPFGLMHRPAGSFSAVLQSPIAVIAGLAWLAAGGIVFVGGLPAAIGGRLGARMRVVALLFLVYALGHSLWYYRYERFMLMALPLAAMIWATAVVRLLDCWKGIRLWSMAVVQLIVAASGLYLGNFYTAAHIAELQKDTSRVRFEGIARAVNERHKGSESSVLTDLGPHLAYHLDAHTFLDTDHGNYWQRAFPPERTLEELDTRGVRFVVTKHEFDPWLDEHHIPPAARNRFTILSSPDESVHIIEYSPK